MRLEIDDFRGIGGSERRSQTAAWRDRLGSITHVFPAAPPGRRGCRGRRRHDDEVWCDLIGTGARSEFAAL